MLLGDSASHVRDVLDAAMLTGPSGWAPFYPQDPAGPPTRGAGPRSDRSRYYWPVDSVRHAVEAMVANLRQRGTPPELLSQYLPVQARQVTAGVLESDPAALMRDKVREVLDDYLAATTE